MSEQNYKELPYAELDTIQRKYSKALDDIQSEKQKLTAKQIDIDNDSALISAEDALSGKRLNGSLSLKTKEKAAIKNSLDELSTRYNSLNPELELIKIQMDVKLRIAIQAAKTKALPSLQAELIEARKDSEDALAKCGALMHLCEGFPLTHIPSDRITRSLNSSVYHALRERHLEEISEKYKLNGGYFHE